MRIYDIITKKRYGNNLSKEEVEFFVKGFIDNTIEDYQASALLMAICINGMDDDELFYLTDAMVKSGEIIDFSEVDDYIVDKHSTGGVGDKVTLIIIAIVASLGVKVAKMSGRGLGHTGGTIDKLESIEGFRTDISLKEFKKLIEINNAAIMGQSREIAVADKKIYALRDVSGTVESIPLIASSIMSKKIALGADIIVFDVTVGKGAFMKNIDDAKLLSKRMIKIAHKYNKKAIAVITNMDEPLGRTVGNRMEVEEAYNFLDGKYEKDVYDVSTTIAACMVQLAKDISYSEAMNLVCDSIKNKTALNKFREIIQSQGGDVDSIFKREQGYKTIDILAQTDGYINELNAYEIGELAVELGAGRIKKDEKLDLNAGIYLHKKYGDCVHKDEKIMTLYTKKEKVVIDADKLFKINNIKPKECSSVYMRVNDEY